MASKRKLVLLLTPFCIFFCLFFLNAFLKSIITSLGYYPIVKLRKITLDYYLSAFSDPSFITISLRTFIFSMISAAFACIIGLFLALCLQRTTGIWKKVFTRFTQIPVMLPHVFIVLALLQLISQTGIISGILLKLGWISSSNQFPLLVNDPWQIGVVITYLWKEIPFVVVSLILVLSSMKIDYRDVAFNLGVSKFQAFCKVTLPLIQTSLINAFIINFSFNFGSYEVPFLLGNQQKELLPVYIYNFYVQGDITKMPLVMALNVILSVFSIIFALILLKISKSLSKWNQG